MGRIEEENMGHSGNQRMGKKRKEGNDKHDSERSARGEIVNEESLSKKLKRAARNRLKKVLGNRGEEGGNEQWQEGEGYWGSQNEIVVYPLKKEGSRSEIKGLPRRAVVFARLLHRNNSLA